MTTQVLTISCPATTGIVAAVSGYLAEAGCNILDSSQFTDLEAGRFFMRLTFVCTLPIDLNELREGFAPVAGRFDMAFEFRDPQVKAKLVIMVSRFGHCLNDLLYRAKIGALPVEIVAVISNHLLWMPLGLQGNSDLLDL